MSGRYDITGGQFGRLTVISKGDVRCRQTSWNCRCECGAEVNVLRHSLVSGATRSCGCYMKEASARHIRARSITHNMRHSAEYSVWSGIKRRCENPNEECFPRYGGAGIKVLFKSFEEFFQEVGPRPTKNHSIDRIDVNGHYERGNVRWATVEVQARNKKSTIIVDLNGERAPLADFCDRFGVPYKRVWQRIKKQNWPVERALELRA